jgi:hypothetical protein
MALRLGLGPACLMPSTGRRRRLDKAEATTEAVCRRGRWSVPLSPADDEQQLDLPAPMPAHGPDPRLAVVGWGRPHREQGQWHPLADAGVQPHVDGL